MNRSTQGVSHTYRVNGDGGQGSCIAVQSVLQEHGLCGYTEWNSPNWRFLFLTHLERDDIFHLLGDLTKQFKIQIENSGTRP